MHTINLKPSTPNPKPATAKAANSPFKPLGDARQLLNADVHKLASAGGVEYILPNKFVSFIVPGALYTEGTQAGWGNRAAAGGTGGFSAEVKTFLTECFDWPQKLQPKAVLNMMKAKFSSKYVPKPYTLKPKPNPQP